MRTPRDVISYCTEALEKDCCELDRNFYTLVRRYMHEGQTMAKEVDRPIPDAADSVATTAAKALEMLKQLQDGWLWRLLTLPPKGIR